MRTKLVDEINLVIIPKDGTQDFWKTVHLGVRKAAQDLQLKTLQYRREYDEPLISYKRNYPRVRIQRHPAGLAGASYVNGKDWLFLCFGLSLSSC
jgi:hypothetical protein